MCTLYKRSPYVVGSKLVNQLPNEVIDIFDLYPFKTRLKDRQLLIKPILAWSQYIEDWCLPPIDTYT